MFHTVRLQPGDSAPQLAALGLKLKRKKGRHYLHQPCPAFRGTHCSIYEARPERCRLFECRQLKQVASGGITAAMALANIHEAHRLVDEVNQILEAAGGTNARRPLSKRCEKAMTEPALDEPALQIHRRLQSLMQELDAVLDRNFRLTPMTAQPAIESGDAQPVD